MFDDDGRYKHVMSLHFQAGNYAVNFFSSDQKLNYQTVMDYAIKKIVELSKEIDVSKQPLRIDDDVA